MINSFHLPSVGRLRMTEGHNRVPSENPTHYSK